MKRLLIIIFVSYAFMVQDANGQSDFQKGYIITQEYDTIIGEIDNRNYYSNSQFCDFRKIKTDSIIRYYPDNLTGYRFTDGKYYVSKEVKDKRVFMEYLINGKLDVYYYQDEFGTDHFYASKDTSSIRELTYNKGIKVIDGEQMYYELKPYVWLLTYFTSDCPKIKEEILKLNEPNHNNLINFAQKYHNLTCLDDKCIIYEKKIPRKIKFRIEGGPNYFFSNVTADLARKLYPSYGFNVLFQQSNKNERLYLGIGVTREGKTDNVNNVIRIPLSINYIHPKQGFSPLLAYEFDLEYLGSLQALKIGMNYKIRKISLFINGAVQTIFFFEPYAVSANFGLMFDLR